VKCIKLDLMDSKGYALTAISASFLMVDNRPDQLRRQFDGEPRSPRWAYRPGKTFFGLRYYYRASPSWTTFPISCLGLRRISRVIFVSSLSLIDPGQPFRPHGLLFFHRVYLPLVERPARSPFPRLDAGGRFRLVWSLLCTQGIS